MQTKRKRPAGGTVPRNFRLNREAMADLERIAQYVAARYGVGSQTAAIRYALRTTAALIQSEK